nr:paxillin [Hymenolepis microstoma]
MENLDALLEDLRLTKQNVLQRNPPLTTPYTNDINVACSTFWSTSSSNKFADIKRPTRTSSSLPRRPLQENLTKLDSIINDLDDLDGSTDAYESHDSGQCTDYEGRPDNSEMPEEDLPGQPPPGSTNGDLYVEPVSQKTKEAAAHASRQLDELMASLQQLKHLPHNNPPQYNQHVHQTQSPSTQRGPLSKNARSCIEQPSEIAEELIYPSPINNNKGLLKSTNGHHVFPQQNNTNGDSNVVFNQPTPTTLCRHCNQSVVGKVITALGGVWHPEHFNCSYCGKNVVEEYFYEHEGAPYCTECHLSLFAPKCAFCGEAIVDRCLEAMDYYWHPDHFFCQECHTPFVDNATAHEHQGKVFCQNCYYSKFGERCGGCRKPITDAYIMAIDQPWHEECFKCKDCGVNLKGRNFFPEDGFLYCELHHRRNSGMVCAACGEPIAGNRCINAMGNRYHLQHFVCTYCLRQLSTGTFKERLGKPYCDPCFRQLFG